MFDSGDFSKSEEYFTILQALRLCRNWVSETLRDVKSIAEKVHEVIDATREGMPEDNLVERSQELQQLDTILARLVADSEALFQPLLDRIERNNEEIKSLRDGVSLSLLLMHSLSLKRRTNSQTCSYSMPPQLEKHPGELAWPRTVPCRTATF
jgi:hypothetical protein